MSRAPGLEDDRRIAARQAEAARESEERADASLREPVGRELSDIDRVLSR